jgi:hypothetical protein
MSERHVCTQRYTLELNSAPITERCLPAAHRLRRNRIYTTRIQRNDTALYILCEDIYVCVCVYYILYTNYIICEGYGFHL